MPKSSRDLSSKERKERLAANIAANGIIMGPRCFHCQRVGVPCQIDLRSGRCVECARLGQSCNQQVTRIEYDKIRQSREKATAELEAAESAEEKMMRKLLEHRGRVRRLRRQLRAKEEKEVEAQVLEAESIAETVQLEEQFLSHPIDSTSLDCLPLELRTENRQNIEATERYEYGMVQEATWPPFDIIGNDTLGEVSYSCR
jgi:hypothetical protein